jgi:hypothetical protein
MKWKETHWMFKTWVGIMCAFVIISLVALSSPLPKTSLQISMIWFDVGIGTGGLIISYIKMKITPKKEVA